MRVTELHRRMLARSMSDDRQWPTLSTLGLLRVHWNRVPFCGSQLRAISPNSPYRMTFGLTGFVVLLLDLSLMPYVLAWDVASETWYVVVCLLMSIFWTSDIVLNFFSGIYRDGDLKLALDVIARNCARTWFAVDLAVVLCDWANLLVLVYFEYFETEGLGSVKMSRVLRLARIIGDYLDRTLTKRDRGCS